MSTGPAILTILPHRRCSCLILAQQYRQGLTAAKADPDLLRLIAAWVCDGQMSLADLAYEGEPETFRVPVKKPKGGQLSEDQQAFNAVHGALRCLGERANSPAQDHPSRSSERSSRVVKQPRSQRRLDQDRAWGERRRRGDRPR